jgi:Catalytic LigB subunit of aromatic ring-opening dioxygenase
MATVAAVIASTHHPFYYRASTSTGADRPPFADEWVAKIETFRQTLTRAEPDVLVMVGSDHFHQLWLDNMPQFLRRPERFVQLGRAIRGMVESWPQDKRVAIIGTGHLSLELGGPRQFGPHGPDPEFDRKAVTWIANGDVDGCLAEVTLDSLHSPGNATHGFMDFMLMMGAAGDGVKADYVDTLDLFHTMEAYFTWYPEGAPAS